MVHGTNIATCSECGRDYITGDCIELDGKCSDCENIEAFDSVVSDLEKKQLKDEVQKILGDALAGYIDKYKYHAEDGKVYIRWGEVQQCINEAIELHWPKGKEK
jgi:hypothetical protein